MYDHGHQGTDGNAGDVLNIDMDTLDFDVTLRERLRRWDLLISGGVRYARQSYSSPTLFPPGEGWFEGVGPTVSFEAARDVGCRGVYLIGSFRSSMLFGDLDFFGVLPVDDELCTVLDNQLGIGWSHRLGCTLLDVRAIWESQFWLNDTFADDFFGFGSNLGFTGPNFAIELRR
jgi:hypothetical protein